MKCEFSQQVYTLMASRARRIVPALWLVIMLIGLQALVAVLPSHANVAYAQATGNITIVKSTVGGDGTFAFASNDVDFGGLSIATTNNTGSSATFIKPAGVYTITEDIAAGWTLANIEVVGDIDGGSTWRIVDRQVVVDLDADEAITVTFTNAASRYTVNTAELSGISSNGAPVGPIASGVPLLIVEVDYGDLPDGSASSPAGLPTNSPGYNTDIIGAVGASHVITPGLYLGSLVDGEIDGQPSIAADGDDTAGAPDDEDGITLPAFITGEAAVVTASVVNTTGLDAYVYGFIDFDGDGAFTTPGEVVSATVLSGASSQDVNLVFNVPVDGDKTQMLGARFRLSTDAGLGPDGPASDGEVEDYLLQIMQPMALGDYVWFDANGDGQQTPGELGLAGATVELFNSDGSPATDINGNAVISQTTDATGLYLFDSLAAGEYVVRVTPPAGYDLTVGGADVDDDPSNRDSNGVIVAGQEYVESLPITLMAGTEPVDDGDADDTTNLSVDFGFVAFDLALRKTVLSTSNVPLVPGASTVTFQIEVFNQGYVTAQDIVVRDYIDPAMFTFNAADNPIGTTGGAVAVGYSWTADATGATATLTGVNLPPQQSLVLEITLQVAANTLGQTLQNDAEIDSATDADGNPAIDHDSTPEAEQGNGPNDLLADNEIADDGDVDEDDHDIATISVDRFDLALVKRVESFSDASLVPGSLVTFTFEVFNQGAVAVTAPITVVDYVQSGFIFEAANNPAWDATDPSNPTIVIDDVIAPGGSVTRTIVLTVDVNTAGLTLANYAEIASDGQPGDADPDSTPDTTPDNDGVVKDNETAEDGQTNPSVDDEDDHDVALVEIPVFDLALIKTIASVSHIPLIPGLSTVEFDIT
ncbi:MAG: hypothetical protein KDE47_08285, partial [Caldilineaceae bacterium]|nr:hypothetical protein [Caldilineaceae bacterium]